MRRDPGATALSSLLTDRTIPPSSVRVGSHQMNARRYGRIAVTRPSSLGADALDQRNLWSILSSDVLFGYISFNIRLIGAKNGWDGLEILPKFGYLCAHRPVKGLPALAAIGVKIRQVQGEVPPLDLCQSVSKQGATDRSLPLSARCLRATSRMTETKLRTYTGIDSLSVRAPSG